MEDDRFIKSMKISTDTSLPKNERVRALERAEQLGLDTRVDQIIAKRTLELQLKGIPKNKAKLIAMDSVERDTGLFKLSPAKVSAV